MVVRYAARSKREAKSKRQAHTPRSSTKEYLRGARKRLIAYNVNELGVRPDVARRLANIMVSAKTHSTEDDEN